MHFFFFFKMATSCFDEVTDKESNKMKTIIIIVLKKMHISNNTSVICLKQ